LKPEMWGSPLVQEEKYQEEMTSDMGHNNNNVYSMRWNNSFNKVTGLGLNHRNSFQGIGKYISLLHHLGPTDNSRSFKSWSTGFAHLLPDLPRQRHILQNKVWNKKEHKLKKQKCTE
jgi:hypothetical protein